MRHILDMFEMFQDIASYVKKNIKGKVEELMDRWNALISNVTNISSLLANKIYRMDGRDMAYLHKEIQRAKAILGRIQRRLLLQILNDIENRCNKIDHGLAGMGIGLFTGNHSRGMVNQEAD